MKQKFAFALVVIVLSASAVLAQKGADIPNPSIDMKAFLKVAKKRPNIEKRVV